MGEYPNLKNLHLANNKITGLPALNCKKLVYLRAQNNLIESLDGFATGEYPNLRGLILRDNELKTIPALNSKELT
jgi:hypothetical protein